MIKYIKRIKLLSILLNLLIKTRNAFRSPIRGENNTVVNNAKLIKVRFDIVGNNNSVEISKGTILSNTLVYMRGSNHSLIIGEDVNYMGGSIWFENNDCRIIIGKNTSVESAHLAVTEPNRSIVIGEDCMFSYGIEVRTGDSHSIIDLDTKKRINLAQNIEIGNHVWIGARSMVLKGVKIEDNSIVGINSIVTKSVANNSIVAGIPAKVIKTNVDWKREQIYE